MSISTLAYNNRVKNVMAFNKLNKLDWHGRPLCILSGTLPTKEEIIDLETNESAVLTQLERKGVKLADSDPKRRTQIVDYIQFQLYGIPMPTRKSHIKQR
jgi:hypothetical protein